MISDTQQGDSSAQATSPIRRMGPFQVSPSLFLTPVWLSDSDELFRILNINGNIAAGLCSPKMTFPFSAEAAQYFTQRHLERRIKSGEVDSWAVRTAIDGPMVGLFAMSDPHDHGEDWGTCIESDTGRRCGGFGFWISPEWGGKGLMTQVLAYGLQTLAGKEFGFTRVHGEAWVENVASCKAMTKAGMRPQPSVKCYIPKFKMYKDVAQYVYDVQPSVK